MIAMSVFILSMILLYAASTIYHTVDSTEKVNRRLRKMDHMMIFILIAGSYTPVCLITLEGRDRIYPLRGSMGGGDRRHYRESLLDHLSEMVFFGDLYRYGMAVCVRLCAYCKGFFAGRFRLASGRRTDLYHWRCDLRVKASDL